MAICATWNIGGEGNAYGDPMKTSCTYCGKVTVWFTKGTVACMVCGVAWRDSGVTWVIENGSGVWSLIPQGTLVVRGMPVETL